ncbi:hypothetical protein CJD_0940 [Clostridium perfringens D str. JGS1721]|uniref:Uncharacterized protein n=1 Tax=Clostridium perfringens D str. JGS1721 TaxID=488537 RepID=B1V3L4_CLOPF|nr:hypothetical protein CJD_0940 [Clostridium perfringens D str. JGS1721]PWX10597.1 hypothetical protein CYK70_03345 [Clostridium perfringens]
MFYRNQLFIFYNLTWYKYYSNIEINLLYFIDILLNNSVVKSYLFENNGINLVANFKIYI